MSLFLRRRVVLPSFIAIVFLLTGFLFLRNQFFKIPHFQVFAQTVTNLLTNPGFESDLSGWSSSGATSISTSDVHSGSKAVKLTGGSVRQRISVSAGKTYKVTVWLKINTGTSCSGDCWGGIQVFLENSQGLTGSTSTSYLTPSNRNLNEWFKESLTFTANSSGTINGGDFKIQPFAGNGWTWNVTVDDAAFFQVSNTPIPPTVSMTASSMQVTNTNQAVQFNASYDDVDGSVDYIFWDFGDGGKSNNANPSHTFISNGVYNAKISVYDDTGLSSSDQKTITVNDPALPSITVTNPSSTSTVSSPSVAFSGSATAGTGANLTKVEWSTDRGLKGTASGTNSWNFTLDLSQYTGKNRVLVVAYDSAGKIARKDTIVDYRPASKVTIQNGAAGVTQNSASVELYDKFEATFTLQNSTASNPYIPYETNVPAGMPSGTGVTVEGIFTAPNGTTYTQPGFIYQPYERDTQRLQIRANGNPVWKLRFGPMQTGAWTYKIRITDASGTTEIVDATKLKFTVGTPTNALNHGFVKVSTTDKRYFEHSDGTPFVGIGAAANLTGDSFATEDLVNKIGPKSANFSRTWMSGKSIAGSSWAPWAGHINYEGNYPGTALTTDEAYGSGIFSLTLPQPNDPTRSCVFYGFHQPKSGIKANTNYRIMVRIKSVGVTGSGGFTFRPGVSDFPNSCNQFATRPLALPYVNGTKDWHVVSSNWNSGNATNTGFSILTLENTTGGRVYIDEVSLREDLGSGALGPEIMQRSKFNVHEYFAQEQSWDWDYGLDLYARNGMYEKTVIEEKGDFVYNHISPYGFGWSYGEQMGSPNTAGMRYEQYFWRYLIARWGYSRAVHSWEYANEQGPGSLIQANELAKYMRENDPHRHLATTSFWCCITNGNQYFWQDTKYPYPDYADTHSYVRTASDDTSWLDGRIDPYTGGSVMDTALYVHGHSVDVLTKNAAGGKPIVMGEAGVGNGSGVTAGNNDSDTQGVWWHQFIWAQVNHGGMYFLYWYDQTLKSRNQYGFVKPYRDFLEGKAGDSLNKRIPFNSGKYQDIQLTTPNELYGWGQKDTVNGGAYFWMYDKNYTWLNTNGGASLAGKQVSFSGMPNKTYTVEWWNTWDGTVVSEDKTPSSGTLTLTVPASMMRKDVAAKIYPKGQGYPGSIPGPIASPNPSPAVGDANGDGQINASDIKQILPVWHGSTLCGFVNCDFLADSQINMLDVGWIIKNFGL